MVSSHSSSSSWGQVLLLNGYLISECWQWAVVGSGRVASSVIQVSPCWIVGRRVVDSSSGRRSWSAVVAGVSVWAVVCPVAVWTVVATAVVWAVVAAVVWAVWGISAVV